MENIDKKQHNKPPCVTKTAWVYIGVDSTSLRDLLQNDYLSTGALVMVLESCGTHHYNKISQRYSTRMKSGEFENPSI